MDEPPIAELELRLQALAGAEAPDSADLIEALNDLAWALRVEDIPRAHALAIDARDRAAAIDDDRGQARAVRTMAMTLTDVERFDEVFDLAAEALRLFDRTEDVSGRAAARDFLASIHERTGNLTEALRLALEALHLAREAKDPVRQGYALSNVGGILVASGEAREAIPRLEEALEYFEAEGNQQGITTIAYRLAVAHKDCDQPAHAERYASRIIEGENSGFFAAGSRAVLAELALLAGDQARSEKLLREAIASLDSEASRNVLGSELHVQLGRVLFERGELEGAEVELLEALTLSQGSRILAVPRAAAHEALADLYESQGDHVATIEHLRAEQSLRDELAQANARNKIAQVEARATMEAARKDAEIHKLRYVELHAMQAKLLEAEKMAILGKLAAGTSHELNSPLGVLKSNAEVVAKASRSLEQLIEDLPSAERAQRLVSAIDSCLAASRQAVERIGAIAENFKRFTQLDQSERKRFDVNEGLDAALALLRPSLEPNVRLERRFEPAAIVHGWPRQLNHAFMTVLENAVRAVDGDGSVIVETAREGDEVLVRVVDDGRGMSPEDTRRLFDVGWSDDGVRTKMRLGLSAAYATTLEHGGTLSATSALGEGTAVMFRLPAARPLSTQL